MKPITRKVIAAMSALCLFSSVFSGLAGSAAFSEDVSRGAFYQETTPFKHTTATAESYSYSDSFFKGNSVTYQPALATASAYLTMAAANSSRADETYQADRDIKAFLEDIGFKNVKANADFNTVPTMDSMGVACGMKTMTDENGQEVTLIAVAPRCGDYGAEWASNFRLGSEGDASGFSDSAQKVLDFLKDYAQENGIQGQVKLWIAGYSRSAAVANIAAARLIDDASAVLGDEAVLSPNQIFAYTIAAPQCAAAVNAPRSETYQGIHNIISQNDFVTCLAPAAYGFERYGTDHIVEEMQTCSDHAAQTGMVDTLVALGFLFGKSPENFKKRLLGMAIDGGSSEAYPVDTDSTNQLPETQEAFIKMLADSFTYSVSQREDYAERIEPYLSELIGCLLPAVGNDLTSLQSDNPVAKSKYGLPLMTYLYMDYELSRIPYVLEEYPDDPEHVEMFFNKIHRLALALRVMSGELTAEESAFVKTYVSTLNAEEAAWIQDVFGDFSPEAIEEARKKTGFAEWNFSDECREEMQQIFVMYGSFLKPGKIGTKGITFTSYSQENYAADTAFVKQRLAVMYKAFMTEVLTQYAIPEEIIAHQTEDAACTAIPEWFERVLLDSPDRKDTYAEDIEDSESVCKMATIMGNIENLLLPHLMGYYLGWLRAADENYTGFEAMDQAHIHGYHGIRLTEAEGSDHLLSGKVFDKDGNLIAAFENKQMCSNTDCWIRLQDDVLRLPLDQAYTVEITSSGTMAFAMEIDEYNTYEGGVVRVVAGESEDDASAWRSLEIAEGDVYTLYVPQVTAPEKDWTDTPVEGYRLEKKEAVQPESPTEKQDAAYSRERLCEMAVKDYEVRMGAAPADARLEMLADGSAQIILTDAEGKTLDTYAVDPDTAKGTDSKGAEVNLPQTGVTSWNTAMAVGSALAMIAAGAWLTGRSLRRKK